jgi:quercetin dioxygenase-like cupin family protein
MARYALRLLEDTLPAGMTTSAVLPARTRVIYVVDGEVTVAMGNQGSLITPNTAWHGAGPCSLTCGAHGARLWRWELVTRPLQHGDVCPGNALISTEKLVHEMNLDPRSQYLMRCDRVDFPPGGIAYTHVHQGPGIRCLLFGIFTVCVHDEQRRIQAGGAWFESGPEPVYATASNTEAAAFVRVMILPRALKGKSSIRYVKPEDQDKPKPQRYTMFLDEDIDL